MTTPTEQTPPVAPDGYEVYKPDIGETIPKGTLQCCPPTLPNWLPIAHDTVSTCLNCWFARPKAREEKIEVPEVRIPYGYRLPDKLNPYVEKNWLYLNTSDEWTSVTAASYIKESIPLRYCRPIDVGEGYRLVGEDEEMKTGDQWLTLPNGNWCDCVANGSWTPKYFISLGHNILAVRRKVDKIFICDACGETCTGEPARRYPGLGCLCLSCVTKKTAEEAKPTPPLGYRIIDPGKDGPKRVGDKFYVKDESNTIWGTISRDKADKDIYFLSNCFYARKIEEPLKSEHHRLQSEALKLESMSGRWVPVAEAMPTREDGDYRFNRKGETAVFKDMTLEVVLRWCEKNPNGNWLHVPPDPPIQPEQSAEEKARDTAIGHVIRYLAQQFPATVGHKPLVEKLDSVFNAGIDFALTKEE